MNETTITRQVAQRNLTLTWTGFTILLTLVYFVQTVGNKYPGQNDEVWDWFSPFAFPTLTLMIGTWVAVNKSTDPEQPKVDKLLYRLAMGAIIVYFLFIFGVIFSAPLAFMSNDTPAFEHLKKFTKPLSAVQAIVTAVLGYFFFRENKGTS